MKWVHQYLNLTLAQPEWNLALDEALLEECAEGGPEVLRVWESPVCFIVLGLSGRAEREVDLEACHRDGMPVLRRISGGGTVLLGPGCLNYTLILKKDRDPALAKVESSHDYILSKLTAGLRRFHPDLRHEGISDMAVGGQKVSGNAQRRIRGAVLLHGTLLYRFDFSPVETYLRFPERRPAYRRDRPHRQFLRNLQTDSASLKQALRETWGGTEDMTGWPEARTASLVARRYAPERERLRAVVEVA